MLVSCALTVVEECPKATAVEMIQDCQQEALIKLKGCRKLRAEEMRGERKGVNQLQIKDGLRSQIREHFGGMVFKIQSVFLL